MSSTITDLPLHEVVLKIMFHEDMEKAAAMKPEDVLWRIDNPEISERHVREVLDWLVRQKKVELYLGRYSIDRIEFLEQKELYENSLEGLDKSTKQKRTLKNKKEVPKKVEKRKTFYVNPPKVKTFKNDLYFFIFGLLCLAYLSYTFLDLNYNFKKSEGLELQYINTIEDLSKPKSLYVSEDELYTKSAKNAISYSFARQNTINKINVKKINKIQFKLDSLAKKNKKELLILQKELSTNINNSNTIIKKLIFSNFLIMLLFIFMYFLYKRK